MDSFDFFFYTQYYEDLKFFNKQGAMLHFLKHGQKEQRMSNMEEFINFLQKENFDSNFYQKLYGLNFSKGQYNHLLSYKHYQSNKGFKNITELKNYLNTKNFDSSFYNKHYNLNLNQEVDIMIHYIKFGEKKNLIVNRSKIQEFSNKEINEDFSRIIKVKDEEISKNNENLNYLKLSLQEKENHLQNMINNFEQEKKQYEIKIKNLISDFENQKKEFEKSRQDIIDSYNLKEAILLNEIDAEKYKYSLESERLEIYNNQKIVKLEEKISTKTNFVNENISKINELKKQYENFKNNESSNMSATRFFFFQQIENEQNQEKILRLLNLSEDKLNNNLLEIRNNLKINLKLCEKKLGDLLVSLDVLNSLKIENKINNKLEEMNKIEKLIELQEINIAEIKAEMLSLKENSHMNSEFEKKENELNILRQQLDIKRSEIDLDRRNFENEQKINRQNLENEKKDIETLIDNYHTHLKIIETEIFLKKKSFRKEVINLLKEDRDNRNYNIINYPEGDNYKYLKMRECLDINNQIFLADYDFLRNMYEKFTDMDTGGIKSYLLKSKKYHIWNNNIMLETMKFINFDSDFYRSHYIDLHSFSNEKKCFKHYVNNGFTENRIVNFDNLLKDNTRKILLLSGNNINIEHTLNELKNDYLIIRDDLVNGGNYSKKCLDLADIVICEKNLDWVLANKRDKNFLILNLLDFNEITLQNIKVDAFNSVIILNKNRPKLLNFYPNINSKLHLVPNYADYKIFKLPKTNDCRINFGLINFTPMSTNPIKCVELFLKIFKKNNNLKLFIKGDNPFTNKKLNCKDEEMEYYKKFFNLISGYKNNIFIDYSEDLNSWISKIGTLFLFNDDSLNIDLIKLGMGCGCVPYVDSCVGKNPFPSKYYNILNSWSNDISNDCRNFIKNSYNLDLDYYEKKQKFIFTKIKGGLGNQLFMLFNLIAASQDYKLKPIITIDNEYFDKYIIPRKKPNEYKLFKKINFSCEHIPRVNLAEYVYNEHKYLEYNLNQKNKSYYIEGYFQSFKYFCKHINEIKKYLYIDEGLKNDIIKKFNSYRKPILSIHVRLSDYLKFPDFHPIPTIDYYKKALSFYNLEKYQIILFSDDIELANEKLRPLKLNYINADTLYNTDEEQLYMLMLSDVRVATNSTFSIMAAYLNEIYLLKEQCEYIFPHKFFGPAGPEFHNEDFKLNYKFNYINYDTIPETYTKKYDVVTNLHIKDKNRYKDFLKYNKKYLLEADKFYYVSYQEYDIDSNYISEDSYPFTKKEVINYIKDYVKSYRWGWYYQQLLKLYIFKTNVIKKDYVLIFDSDLLFLKNISFFEYGKPKLFKRNTEASGGKIHKPYQDSINYLIPELDIKSEESGICHFMLFNKKNIEDLLSFVENKFNKPAWMAFMDSVIDYISKNGYDESLFSEYELYYSFTKDKNIYFYDYDFKYIDCPIEKLPIINDFNLVADHHYQSRSPESWKEDNLLEEHIEDLKKIDIIIKKYTNKKIIYQEHHKYHNDIFINKLFDFLSAEKVLEILHDKFTTEKTCSILYYETKTLITEKRVEVDKLINKTISNIPDSFNNLIKNNYIRKIRTNIKKTDTFYFGIVVPVYNRYYITKIFFECLKRNVNFNSIVFCIVDDGSDYDTCRILDNLDVINYVVVYCSRGKNFYGSNNTTIPGSMYPLTLYIGHEIIKNRCNILGVLDSDSFIEVDYFKKCEEYTQFFDMNKTIFSGFNSFNESHKILKTEVINNNNFVYKNMVGGISQFYSTSLYEQFKLKFTGEESIHFFAYDYDFQISNFMNKNKKQYICLEKSIVQHIGIKTCMIRNETVLKNNEKQIINTVKELLINPEKKNELNFDFDFDINLEFNKSVVDNIFKNLYIDNFIDKIYYINLDERADRQKEIERQLNNFKITNYERFPAIKLNFNPKYDTNFINNEINKFLNNEEIVDDLVEDVPSKYFKDFSKDYIKQKQLPEIKKYILGALGCKLSHLKCIQESNKLNLDNILILEDDAILHDNFVNIVINLFQQLKDTKYDMLWLSPNFLYKDSGGILNRCSNYKYISDNLAQIDNAMYIDGCYGSTLNNGGNIFSKECISYICDIFDNTKQPEMDIWYRENIQKRGNVYTPIPNLITQRCEPSNIESHLVHYSKDLHYKTRQKFNIFTIVSIENKDLYFDNLKNNLKNMIGYENIYYISEEKLFDNEILIHLDVKMFENIENDKNEILNKVNDNNIIYYYYMDANLKFTEIFLPFDENNFLIKKDNFYIKN